MRASPIVKNQNAGEWSPLLEGRIDLAKYPASLRRAYNAVITPQGPTIRRSGTAQQAPVFNETKQSYLLPFVFSNDQAMQVEAANGRFRFHDETGLLARPPTAITAATAAGSVITSPGNGAVIGEQIVLAGFEFERNLNGRILNVTGVAGDDVTVNFAFPGIVGDLSAATMARVYHIASPYDDTEVSGLRYVADQDTLFLFLDGKVHKKLQRFGAYDWRIADMVSVDGPYGPTNDTATILTPNGTGGLGNHVPTMTGATTPSGVASADTESVGHEAWHAFDGNRNTYWEATSSQAAELQYLFATAQVVNGYALEMATVNDDVNYTSIDYAPGDWTFDGSQDGVTWTTLDTQRGYVLYDGGRSAYFALLNTTAYLYYRINITRTTRNGALTPRVATLAMTSVASNFVIFDASSVTNINNGAGFLATDVGRLIRFQGSDSFWRPFRIDIVSTSTKVQCKAMADPLFDFSGNVNWRLGMFSDTTGYPTCGTFFEDRLCMGGMSGYPDYVVCSVSGKYEVMQQTETSGLVVDDNALVLKLNARKQGRVVWLTSDLRSLLVGTGSSEWTISSADPNAALSAKTVKARPGSRRGSANVEPLQIDNQTIFVQRANRTFREFSYNFNVDGYQSPSLSLFSSHLGQPRFLQLEFAAEPHALAFSRRGDGTIAALTYNKEEDVTGWQVIDVGGFVECISVIPAMDGTQDALWMIVRRVFNGVTRRFVERLTRFWDFDSVILDAYFTDCHVVYDGDPISTVFGLYQYEGVRLCGLADGSPIPPQTVVNGSITLDVPASKICLGVGYDSLVEGSRLEAGATTGTAQGKIKRVNDMKLRLWQTGGGEYAVRNIDGQVTDYTKLEYLTPDTPLDGIPTLFNGDTNKLDMPQAFSTDGTLLYRQKGEIPLPMNVVALLPVLVTQDG